MAAGRLRSTEPPDEDASLSHRNQNLSIWLRDSRRVNVIAIAMAIWIAAVPGLCRAGLLSGCCLNDSEPGLGSAHDGHSHNDILEAETLHAPCGCDTEPMSTPPARQCSTCAPVCVGGVTPTERSQQVSSVVEFFEAHPGALTAPTMRSAEIPQDHWPDRRCLPFPRSDTPLLI